MLTPDAKSQLIGKDPDAETDWERERRTAEGEMVGWHHWFSECELGQTRTDREGQGGLASCGHGATKSWTRLSDWTTTTNWGSGKHQTAGKRGSRAQTQAISLRSLGRHSRQVRAENTVSQKSHRAQQQPENPNSPLVPTAKPSREWSPSSASHQTRPPISPSRLRKPEPGLLLPTQNLCSWLAVSKACSQRAAPASFLRCARI